MSAAGDVEEGARHGRAILRGIAVTLSSNFLARFLNLAITIILARTVAPDGMGVVAAALLCVEIVDTSRDLGLREALIFEPSPRQSLYSTAFVVTLVLALLQALVLLGIAPAAPLFVDAPEIVPVLACLALLFPLNALGSVQESLLQKDLRFGRASVSEIAAAATKTVVAIGLLAAGAGIWALVAGILAGAAARSAALWIMSAWRPSLAMPRRDEVRHLIGYGRHIVFVNIMTITRLKADQIVILLAMGDAALGLYFVAARIPEIAIFGVNVAITRVIFPAYSSIAADRTKLAQAYLHTIRGCMTLMAPVSVGLAMVADPAGALPLRRGLARRGAGPADAGAERHPDDAGLERRRRLQGHRAAASPLAPLHPRDRCDRPPRLARGGRDRRSRAGRRRHGGRRGRRGGLPAQFHAPLRRRGRRRDAGLGRPLPRRRRADGARRRARRPPDRGRAGAPPPRGRIPVGIAAYALAILAIDRQGVEEVLRLLRRR